MRNDKGNENLNVVDKPNSELSKTGIPGTYFVTVKLKDGFKYDDYTAKIKDISKELVYDKELEKFFYTDYKTSPDSVTVIVTEKSTGKTQEIWLSQIK